MPLTSSMPLTFYVATSFGNKEGHRKATKELEALGHTLTFDWTQQATRLLTPKVLEAIALHEIAGVKAADYVVVLLPGRLGTHVEIGAALALGKPVILVVGHPTNLNDDSGIPFPFYHHPSMHRVTDIVGAVRAAKSMTRHEGEEAAK